MARRLFDIIDIVEVLQHWYSGRSKTDVATSLGIDRGTIGKYVTPAEAAGMVPGGEPVSRAEWAVLAAGLMTVNALHRLRACQGVIGLADKYDTIRLNAACRRAIDVGDPTYRTVKGILIARTETDTTTSPAPAPVVPAHLHGPQRLFVIDNNDVIDDNDDGEQQDAVGGDMIDLSITVDIEVAS